MNHYTSAVLKTCGILFSVIGAELSIRGMPLLNIAFPLILAVAFFTIDGILLSQANKKP